jgi:hypothetical protein
MSARALYSHAKTINSAEEYAPEFYSGERICPPSARGGSSTMLWAYLFSFAAFAGVWALLDRNATWREWPPAAMSALYSSISHQASSPTEPASSQAAKAAAVEPPPSNLHPLAANEIADAPGVAEKSTSPEPAAATIAPASDKASAPSVTAPADPYQKRAEAVGLHPDLSRVLLARLSAVDYRNAGVAIKTALAKTAEDGVFVWPSTPKPGLALFKVHFVAGAAADCRRYVVTVTKDRWTTTALPMEKCGVKPVHQSGKRAAAQ